MRTTAETSASDKEPYDDRWQQLKAMPPVAPWWDEYGRATDPGMTWVGPYDGLVLAEVIEWLRQDALAGEASRGGTGQARRGACARAGPQGPMVHE
jgi:hypothetical protein